MRAVIAGFYSDYFYEGLLQSAEHLCNKGAHITFIDTVGWGYNEMRSKGGTSL